MSAFHNRRDLLLQSLRITFEQSLVEELDDDYKDALVDIIAQVLDIQSGVQGNGSLFTRKCIDTLGDIENFQARIADALQSKAILGEPRGSEFYLTFEFQRDSLFKQHEALASILAFLFRGNYTNAEDLRKLHNVVKVWSRLDFNLIHYLPALSSAFRLYGAAESGQIQAEQADSLNNVLGTMPKDSISIAIRPFNAVLVLLWTVEYSGRFRDMGDDRDGQKRGDVVKHALQDDALGFLLLICTSTNADVWRHPARQELVALLLSETTALPLDGDQTSAYFRTLLMESLENFVEAFITNMPDSIRRLKTEEDDQRLNQLIAVQEGLPINHRDGNVSKLHLESFLVLISYAFEQRPEASLQWWEDPDNNLYGFLQWASSRQTVPRVSAFCELLCSISEDQECADATHKFLLDESLPTPARGRRNPSMNYNQMFEVLELYANKVHERVATSQLPNARKLGPSDMNELESPVMLSCYLRLLAHLCKQPSATRSFILESRPSFPQSLLILSSGPVPSYLKASIFATLDALLTSKTVQTSTEMWQTLDTWASVGHDALRATTTQPAQPLKATTSRLLSTLSSIGHSFDQYDGFVVFLRDLITPNPTTGSNADLLPFPSDLGSSYRATGIGPYIDFVCGQVFVKRIPELVDETQRLIGIFHCLEFIAIGIEGFNEDYMAMLDRSGANKQTSSDAPPTAVYAQHSPFARLMQWVLSTDMNKLIMESMLVDPEIVESTPPDSPLQLGLQRAIDIVNRLLDLQPTYFDIVKPLIQSQLAQERTIRSSVACIEDAIVAHPKVVLKLCQFAATNHADLSLRSLALLQKLSSSAKLNNHFLATEIVRGRSTRLLDALGPNAGFELQPVSVNLSSRLAVDMRELEEGFQSIGYLTKDGILTFFNACLETQPDLPNIAHLLLGFDRIGERLVLSDSIDEGTSVFNTVADLIQSYPGGEAGDFISWLLHIRTVALHVLRDLWTSRLSSEIVLGQLRRIQFLQMQYIQQAVISQYTLWDGISILHPTFWFTVSAEGLADFFAYRASLYHYSTTELRSAAAGRLSNTLRLALSTLEGKTSDTDGSLIMHADIYALFDFLDLDLSTTCKPVVIFYSDADFSAFMTETDEGPTGLYNLKLVREWLNAARFNHMQNIYESAERRQEIDEEISAEATNILSALEAENRATFARKMRAETLHEYVELIIAVVECCPMDSAATSQFILRMLQIMLPKLDAYIADESPDVLELARAADALLFSLSGTSQSDSHTEDMITEKLFQLFRASIEGIPTPTSISNSGLRTTLYSICIQYLSRLMSGSDADTDITVRSRRITMDCVRSASVRLIQTICDDADDGIDACRIHAFNLLGLLTSLARTEKSSFVLNSLVKANALEILIDPLKYIASEFQSTEPTSKSHHHLFPRTDLTLTSPKPDRPQLLSVFEARMLLLLQISRNREGAGSLLDAGVVSVLRDSGLFTADPDLGISIPNNTTTTSSSSLTFTTTAHSALRTYYALISSSLRLLLSTFTSRGAQNEQIQYLARAFLTEYRPHMVGIFKKYAGVNGKVDEKSRPLLAEAVRCYTGLVSLCGFVDVSLFLSYPIPLQPRESGRTFEYANILFSE